jgi:hypothetical protein
MTVADGSLPRWARWALWAIWSVLVVYLFDILNPGTSPTASWVLGFCARLGLPPGFASKMVHVVSYAVWAFLWLGALSGGYLRPLEGRLWPWAVAGLVAFAVGIEMLQHLNSARVAAWKDVGFNLGGILLGLSLRALARRCLPSRGGEANPLPGIHGAS